MRFRRRPETVTAVQWWPTGDVRHTDCPYIRKEDPEIANSPDHYWPARGWMLDAQGLWLQVNPGDWIIEEAGDRYTVTDKHFRLCFEPDPDHSSSHILKIDS